MLFFCSSVVVLFFCFCGISLFLRHHDEIKISFLLQFLKFQRIFFSDLLFNIKMYFLTWNVTKRNSDKYPAAIKVHQLFPVMAAISHVSDIPDVFNVPDVADASGLYSGSSRVPALPASEPKSIMGSTDSSTSSTSSASRVTTSFTTWWPFEEEIPANIRSWTSHLNAQQCRFLSDVLLGANVMLTGAAGTGKSEAFRTAIKVCRELFDRHEVLETTSPSVLALAPTGLAAANFDGDTIHKALGVAPHMRIRALRIIGGAKRKKLQRVRALFVDECGMVTVELMKQINTVMQSAKKSASFMGGVQLIMCGDFYQLAPIDGKYLFEDKVLWKSLVQFHHDFKVNLRHENKRFASMCARLRVGEPTFHDLALLNSRYAAHKKMQRLKDSSTILAYDRPMVTATRLVCRVKEATKINDAHVNALRFQLQQHATDGLDAVDDSGVHHERIYVAIITLERIVEMSLMPMVLAPREFSAKGWHLFLETIGCTIIDPACFKDRMWFRHAPTLLRKFSAKVTLLKGLRVMVTVSLTAMGFYERELDSVLQMNPPSVMNEVQLRNGMQGAVVGFVPQSCKVAVPVKLLKPLVADLRVMGGRSWPTKISVLKNHELLPVVKFDSLKMCCCIPVVRHILNVGNKLGLTIRQVPLIPAGAVTIHRAQGMTLDKAHIDLRSVFCAGQAYVAVSRVRKLEDLTLEHPVKTSMFYPNPRVQSFFRKISESPEKASKREKPEKTSKAHFQGEAKEESCKFDAIEDPTDNNFTETDSTKIVPVTPVTKTAVSNLLVRKSPMKPSPSNVLLKTHTMKRSFSKELCFEDESEDSDCWSMEKKHTRKRRRRE